MNNTPTRIHLKSISPYFSFFIAVILLIIPMAVGAYEFQFEKAGLSINVLSQEEFLKQFGDNDDIPRTDADVIALARLLFPPFWSSTDETTTSGVFCREEQIGLLFAALQNPAVSDTTRCEIEMLVVDAIPPLPKKYSSGHFVIHYTKTNANNQHNITDEDAKLTADLLNTYWNKYAGRFKTPKYYISHGKKLIDIKIFHIGGGTLGETNSSWNYISLSSAAARDDCYRKIVPSHELFHRVQYSYGFASGAANMKWMTEGSATWAMKYTDLPEKEYMNFMNSALGNMDAWLLSRSYDAVLFWVYLAERGSWLAVKEAWSAYNGNGHNGQAAVAAAILNKCKVDFDTFFLQWSKANYMKDLSNHGNFGYDENKISKTNCGRHYGPLNNVHTVVHAVHPNTKAKYAGHVSAYGADYWEFTISRDVKSVQIKVTGLNPGQFSYCFIGVKGTRWLEAKDTVSNQYILMKGFKKVRWNKIGLVVCGRATGGQYEVEVSIPKGFNIDLTWGPIGADVDLHFRPPDGAGYSGYNYGNDCAYYNKNPDWGDHGYPDDNPVLNYDCITTCADENIQLEEVGQNGIYKVVIHYFRNHGKGNATATVTVYYNGEQVALGRRTLANRGDSPEKGDVWIPYQVTVKQTGEVTVKNLDEVTVDNADDGAPFPKEEPGTY